MVITVTIESIFKWIGVGRTHNTKMKEMKKALNLIAVILLFSAPNFAFSQTNQISVEFLGNCGLYLTDGTTNIYIDFPYKSGAYGYMEYDELELDSIKENAYFIFTHKHADHYSKKLLKKAMKKKKGSTYGVSNIADLENLGSKIEDFSIKAFKTKHTFFGIPFRHYSYLITWHGKKIYLSGDTTNPETIGSVKDIDWAFVPYWLLSNAKEEGIEIDAKMFFVYHLYPQQIPGAKEAFDKVENIHPLTEQGEVISLNY